MYYTHRFNPLVPIPKEASDVHGITDDHVIGEPTFAEMAARVAQVFNSSDFGGYNIRQFDLPVLDEELRRSGLKINLQDKLIFDASVIFRKKESRTLTDAVAKYCPNFGQHLAHSAKDDTIATVAVFGAQLEQYADLSAMNAEQISTFCADREIVDLAGKLTRNDEGIVCYAFGKHKGKPVTSERGYAQWMLRSNFPGSTCEELKRLL